MASTAHIIYGVFDELGMVKGDAVTNNTAITVSGSSQTSSATCPYRDLRSYAWVYIDGDTDVWVTIGASPTASNGSGFLMPAGTAQYFTAKHGDAVAVINAS